MPVEYLEHVFKRNAPFSNDEKILDEFYMFTKFILREHPEMINFEHSRVFWENYNMLIKNITMDNVSWRRRFSRLLFEIQKRTEIQDDKDGDII